MHSKIITHQITSISSKSLLQLLQESTNTFLQLPCSFFKLSSRCFRRLRIVLDSFIFRRPVHLLMDRVIRRHRLGTAQRGVSLRIIELRKTTGRSRRIDRRRWKARRCKSGRAHTRRHTGRAGVVCVLRYWDVLRLLSVSGWTRRWVCGGVGVGTRIISGYSWSGGRWCEGVLEMLRER
jgi:hypothetical protein